MDHSRNRLPVFVYGTLRPGEKNYPAYLQGNTVRELPASVAGELHFAAEGGYPYLIAGAGTVQGELITLDPGRYAAILRRLDELEEYDPGNEPGSVYLRRRAVVRLTGGGTAEAWVYYWNGERCGERIASGDFKNAGGKR